MSHVSMWILSGCSTLVPQHSDKHVQLIGDSKLLNWCECGVCVWLFALLCKPYDKLAT